jgi:GWxTD domain-containing protein
MPRRHRSLLFLIPIVCLGLNPHSAHSQNQATSQSMSPESKLPEIYKKWLEEDVRWIISDKERADFKQLSSDKQRDDFVIAFWERRNPTPAAQHNQFKEQHYQRLAYANTHFAESAPGWKTDRGRIYILFGPPDKVVHALSGSVRRTNLGAEGWPQFYLDDFGRIAPIVDKAESDNIRRSLFDSEEWYWAQIDGIGHDVTIKFVDTCFCGEYRIPLHRSEKDPPEIKQSFPQP